MKLLIVFLATFCLTSCFSTQYIAEKHHGNFDKIHAGKKYSIVDKDNNKVSLYVTSIEQDSIRGNRKNLPFAIAKNDIKKVRKNNTAGTALIAGGAVAGVTVITVALINVTEDVSDIFLPSEY